MKTLVSRVINASILGLIPFTVMGLDANFNTKLTFSPQIASVQLNTSAIDTALSNKGLTSKFEEVMTKSLRKDLLLKLYPCLDSVTDSQLQSFANRLRRLSKNWLAQHDLNFTPAIKPNNPPFTLEQKAMASISGVQAASKKSIDLAKLKGMLAPSVKTFGFLPSSNTITATAQASTASTEAEVDLDLIPSSDQGFRSNIIAGAVRCQIQIDGQWKTIMSEQYYVNTPCHLLRVDMAKFAPEDELTDEETPTSSCSSAKWKGHVFDFAKKYLSFEVVKQPVLPPFRVSSRVNQEVFEGLGITAAAMVGH